MTPLNIVLWLSVTCVTIVDFMLSFIVGANHEGLVVILASTGLLIVWLALSISGCGKSTVESVGKAPRPVTTMTLVRSKPTMSFAISFVLIVMCLIFQYNGWSKPLAILSTLPLALSGGALWEGLAWCMIVGLLLTTTLTRMALSTAIYAILVETFGVHQRFKFR